MVTTETRYEVLTNINLQKLICLGILPCHLLDWKLFYEKYESELIENNSKEQAYQNTADEYGVSTKTVKRAVKFMTSQ